MEKKNIKIIVEGVINKMIPNNKNFLNTETSKIVKIDTFLKIIKKNNVFKKKIKNLENLMKESRNNFKHLVYEIFKSRIIEKEVEQPLLENYFMSIKFIKKVEKETQIFLKKNKEKDINYLLRFVKKSKLKYKNI
jgi:hypothetical protein